MQAELAPDLVDVGSASAPANRHRVIDSHATAQPHPTNVSGLSQRHNEFGDLSSPMHGIGSLGSGGDMEQQGSMYTTPGGYENSQAPSYQNKMNPPNYGQMYTSYQQAPNSFPIQSQEYPYAPDAASRRQQPAYSNPAYPHTAPSNDYSFPARDKSYATRNPSQDTDHAGINIRFRCGRWISSSEGGRQDLDPAFKVEEDQWKFFTEGRVFKLYWAAPRGSNAPKSEPEGSLFDCGPYAHAKIQRFVVVKPDHLQGYSYCLPISTNGGKGAAKKGLRQEEHTIVYTSTEVPRKLPSETHLHKQPIKIDIVNPSEKLDPLSRLNLGKLYPVEHNVRVCEVGQVRGEHKRILLHYYRTEMQKQFQS